MSLNPLISRKEVKKRMKKANINALDTIKNLLPEGTRLNTFEPLYSNKE
jgi:hypothetical protein